MTIQKWLGALAGICMVSCCCAQTGKIVRQLARTEQKVSRAAASAVKFTHPHRLPSASGAFSVRSAAVERYVFKSVKLTPPAKLVYNFDETEVPYSWILETRNIYDAAMQKFLAFKKEMDVLLYYQSHPSEQRTLHSEEIARWRQEMDDVGGALSEVCWRVNAEDPALSAALEYMTYAKWSIFPHAKDLYFTKPLPMRTDRVFDAAEFFLRDPVPQETHWEFASSRAKRIAQKLPAGLRVAVVNDFVFFRKRVAELHRKGVLFPDRELVTFETAEDLLSYMQNNQRFDVILTDIVVGGTGGGGYYLTSELRQRGYDGTIIALSSYEESAEIGQTMFEHGLDGMISLAGNSAFKRSWPAEVMQRVLNHFYYRDLHNWNH